MIVDKNYCMSSYLMFRTIADPNRCFAQGVLPNLWNENRNLAMVKNGEELIEALRKRIEVACEGKSRIALALSGGIDSAVLAKLVPKDTTAYTFKCIVPGVQVKDETPGAAKFAKECGLDHRVIEITWEDCEKYAPVLMKHKGAPIHSIEIQIYKAALQAKEDGHDLFIFGESSDLNYGGLSDLMSKDRTVGEFIDRYNYVQPYHALRNPVFIMEPYKRYVLDNGYFDTHEFCRNFFLREAMGSYSNACECAGIQLETPYVHTWLAEDIDLNRIRAGENKYVVREAFASLYPGFEPAPKTPMPRPMDEWMSGWNGPKREEFWPNCCTGMTGDQKWMLYALETFLNMLDEA